MESCHFIYIFLKYFLPFLLLKSWLLICNVIINQSSPPISLDVEKSYNGISCYNHTKLVLSPDGMREMRTILPFYQLGLHCCKQQHGRTFLVKTAINASGGAVVGFFSGHTDVFPNACGSFEKLKGDNSVLASRCVEWGKEKGPYRVGKWGHEGQKELSVYSAFIVGSYHRITWPGSNIWECDDTLEKIAASGDFWRIYFRWKLCCHFCILEHFLFTFETLAFSTTMWRV